MGIDIPHSGVRSDADTELRLFLFKFFKARGNWSECRKVWKQIKKFRRENNIPDDLFKHKYNRIRYLFSKKQEKDVIEHFCQAHNQFLVELYPQIGSPFTSTTHH